MFEWWLNKHLIKNIVTASALLLWARQRIHQLTGLLERWIYTVFKHQGHKSDSYIWWATGKILLLTVKTLHNHNPEKDNKRFEKTFTFYSISVRK